MLFTASLAAVTVGYGTAVNSAFCLSSLEVATSITDFLVASSCSFTGWQCKHETLCLLSVRSCCIVVAAHLNKAISHHLVSIRHQT